MRLANGMTVVLLLLLAGCSDPAPKASSSAATAGAGSQPAVADAGNAATETGGATESAGSGTAAATTDTTSAEEAAAGGNKPVPIESGVATLGPENTKIVFVGTHAPPKAPDPRTGIFSRFTGKAEVDGKTLKSLSIEIDTTSIATQFDKLTAHLNSPDFFDTREYPTAKFVSTKITPGDGGITMVTGNLTLLATTKEISFPASVTITDQGLTYNAEFTIDRTEFGMDKLTEGVEKPVKLMAIIGEKTEPLSPAGPPGGGGGKRQKRGE